MFTIMGNALFGEQFADDYGTIASAFERCLFIMVGEFGPYDDIIATPGLEFSLGFGSGSTSASSSSSS